MIVRKIKISIESIMVILLLIIMAISISVLIYSGSKTYRTIIDNKNNQENARIAMSFVQKRIHQNDVRGKVYVDETILENQKVLVLHHSGEEEGLVTYIYFQDGILWECYTEGKLIHDFASEIIEVKNIEFSQSENGKQIESLIEYEHGNESVWIRQKTTFRSGK